MLGRQVWRQPECRKKNTFQIFPDHLGQDCLVRAAILPSEPIEYKARRAARAGGPVTGDGGMDELLTAESVNRPCARGTERGAVDWSAFWSATVGPKHVRSTGSVSFVRGATSSCHMTHVFRSVGSGQANVNVYISPPRSTAVDAGVVKGQASCRSSLGRNACDFPRWGCVGSNVC